MMNDYIEWKRDQFKLKPEFTVPHNSYFYFNNERWEVVSTTWDLYQYKVPLYHCKTEKCKWELFSFADVEKFVKDYKTYYLKED